MSAKKRTPALRVLPGDNRETLHQVKAETVQTVITSPPYWAVRDYNTQPVEFPAMDFRPAIGLPPLEVPAWAGQLGMEPDPWHFIGHLLLTFRQVARVLRQDGTCWVNLGDTYYSGQGGNVPLKTMAGGQPTPGTTGKGLGGPKHPRGTTPSRYTTPNRVPLAGWKPKDLVGIPWMFAKAMQAEVWTLRSDVIWQKPNPMPGSQKDRPTSAHEYLFLFSKAERYFYDNEAVKEPVVCEVQENAPTGWATGPGNHRSLKGRHRHRPPRGSFNGKTEAMADTGRNAFRATRTMRERRDVWTIASRPFKGAHFATFPLDLVLPCLLAGTSQRGACPTCGAPWRRLVGTVRRPIEPPPTGDPALLELNGAGVAGYVEETTTTGWRPTCVCGSDPTLGMRHDDLEEMETPTGEQVGECRALQEGRAAGKSSGEYTGKRRITWYEHRRYAAQIQSWPKATRKQEKEHVRQHHGTRAFEHYLRLDRDGARPIPPELLARWIAAGHLQEVAVPVWEYAPPVPCVALDPFAGSGTVGEAALEHGRHAILCELAEHYLPIIDERTTVTMPLPI